MLREDAPLYHNAMCNGTEENFNFCQLPYPSSLTSCPSIGAVTCTEGLCSISVFPGQHTYLKQDGPPSLTLEHQRKWVEI